MLQGVYNETMEQLIEEYFAYLAIERGASPLTIDAYAKDLATYRAFLEERGKTDLSSIEREDILAFQKSQLDQGFAVSTLERRLSAIKGLHRFALREGYGDAVQLKRPSSQEAWPPSRCAFDRSGERSARQR